MSEVWAYYQSVIIGHALQLLTLAAGVAIVSLSPIGRGALAAIAARRQDRAINEQLLAELEALRSTLGEVTERLDATERLLKTQADARPLLASAPPSSPRSQVNTPH